MDLEKQHARVKEVFLEAVKKELKDLPGFLDEACGDDDKLRRDVESLLRYHLPTDRPTGQTKY